MTYSPDHTSASRGPVHLSVALNGTGWHPASWRDDRAHPRALFDIDYWSELVHLAESGIIEFVTLEDALGVQSSRLNYPDARTDQVRGHLDAVLTLAAIAPTTTDIGLIPTVNVTHTEPFHVSTQIASLDFASSGRAGLRPQITFRAADSANIGRKTTPQLTDDDITDPVKISRRLEGLFDDAAHYLASVRDLWDSWDDDSVIRDSATHRYIDRSRLHTLTARDGHFTPSGPSITPRPPQGQPIIAALGHAPIPYRLAVREADIVFITPHTDDDVRDTLTAVHALARQHRSSRYHPISVFADLTVLIDAPDASRARADRLDAQLDAGWASDSRIHVGSAQQLADLIQRWHGLGVDGFRLRPAVLPTDLHRIVDELVPILNDRALRPAPQQGATLRARLHLPPAESRFHRAAEGVVASTT